MTEERSYQTERDARLEKLTHIQSLGIQPYPSRSERSITCAKLHDQFEAMETSQQSVTVVGRIRLLRKHGGITFMTIADASGDFQLFLKKDVVGEDAYAQIKDFFDVGDFIEAVGPVFRTNAGEETIAVQRFRMLSKALRPLPDKWHGLKDPEERLRRRYIDLIMDTDVRAVFDKRTRFMALVREFMDKKGFMAVETPVLEHVPGGAEAEPFITHHNTLDIDLYLRISLELSLKRLIVGGYEKIYEIGKVFRNEGMSPQHLQEFTELEFYSAYTDYNQLMALVEEFYSTVIQGLLGTLQVKYKEHVLDFTTPWPRVDYVELVKERVGIDLDTVTDVETLKSLIKEKNIDIKFDDHAGLGRVIDQLYKKTVRPSLLQPCFLINHPKVISPLSKESFEHPERVERFQVLMSGAEVGNGFSELNDPVEQKKRFLAQMSLREAGDAEAHIIDEDFIEALEYGMPPTAGFGVGLDRLLMILLDLPTIRDVVFFPTMRPKQDAE